MRPAPNALPPGPSSHDNGGFFLIVTALGCCLGAWLVWNNYHGAISGFVIQVHHAEIGCLRLFTNRFDLADRQMAVANPQHVALASLYGIAHDVGLAVRIPAVALMLMLAVTCAVRAAPARYKRALNLDRLIRQQALSYPTCAAFAGRRLRLVAPVAKPRPADCALTPEEWIAANATGDDGTFDEAAAWRSLALQLGPMWRGVDLAAAHVQAIFAAFALHLAERRSEAQRLLGNLSRAIATRVDKAPAGPEQPLCLPPSALAEARAVLSDYTVIAPAASICRRHAHTHTALMALLNEARRKAGVLAPAQFVWLKLVDRSLWYALHALGFETDGTARYLHPNARTEAAGACSHWTAERLLGRPIIKPEMDRVVGALRKVALNTPNIERQQTS